MSRLNRIIENNTISTGPKVKENKKIPVYNGKGKIVRQGNTAKRKKLAIFLFIFSGLLLFLYVPQIFIRDKKEFVNNYVKSPDPAFIKQESDYYSKNLSEDYDGDKLDNAAEDKFNCNPWDNDTDNDGADDYYEIYISKTDPNKYDGDILLNYQKDLDSSSGATAKTPYKMNNVILWADDYNSKAYGTVIDTPRGYHFNNFKGYAQFPFGENIVAYTTDGGRYQKLEYLKKENAWYIDGYHNIEIYDSPIEEGVKLGVFFHPIYVKSNFFTKTLAFILPSKGFITGEKITASDIVPDTTPIISADNHDINYNIESGARFKRTTNALSDLQYVRSMIDQNKCVMVSFYSPANGELRGIIYGYDNYNRLYIADEETLTTLGTICVDEQARKILTGDGELVVQPFFTWYGLGFSSKNYDRISFFAAANGGGTNIATPTDPTIIIPDEPAESTSEDNPETATEINTETQTEAPTEIPSETPSETQSEAPITEVPADNQNAPE